MKKIIASSIVAIGLALPLQAFASGNDTTTTLDAKYSPDSVFYPLHTLMEEIHLFFASEGAGKAAVLQQNADERLAEAQAMLEQKKTSLTTEQLKAYEDTLKQLETQLNQAIAKEQDLSSFLKTLDSQQQAVTSTTADITKNLTSEDDQKVASDMEDTQGDVQDLADTVKLVTGEDENGSDEQKATDGQKATTTDNQTTTTGDQATTGDQKATEDQQKDSQHQQAVQQVLTAKVGADALTKAQAAGLNARQILAIQSLAQLSGKSFNDVYSLFGQDNKGIGALAKALNIQPKDAMKAINKDFHQFKKDVKDAFKKGSNTDAQGQTQDSTQASNQDGTTTTQGSTTTQDSSQATTGTQDSTQATTGSDTTNQATTTNTQASTSTDVQATTDTKDQPAKETKGNAVSQAVHNAQSQTYSSGKEKGQAISHAAHQANGSQSHKSDEQTSVNVSVNGDSNGQEDSHKKGDSHKEGDSHQHGESNHDGNSQD